MQRVRGRQEKLSEKYTSLHSDPLSKSLKIVKGYLVAATAKDLSMMISFRPTRNTDVGSSHDVFLLKSNNQSFEYKVSFIDLDMKPLKMEYCYELDQKIVSCYSQIEKTKHHTVNGAASIKETLCCEQSSAVEDASHVRDSAVIGA